MSRILIIDDEKHIRRMVQLALSKAGHEVEVAGGGMQGLNRFEYGSNWNLTIVDQRMPGMEGREFIIAARKRDPAARIMMMTSFATSELAADVLRAGATDFLRKPFSTDMLRDAVAAALARERQSLENIIFTDGVATSASPPISYYLNGFYFWPVAIPDLNVRPPGFEIAILFQVNGPAGESRRCEVGITPHVRVQIQAEVGRDLPESDTVWETVCQQALSNYIWEKAEMPPVLLPVFEVTSGQLYDIRCVTHMQPTEL